MTSSFDPVTLQVMTNAVFSVAEEMVATLVRTSFSTNVKDRRDCSAAVFSADRELIGQSEVGTPLHLGVMLPTVLTALKAVPPETLEPGDQIIVNSPYPEGPGHLNDIALVAPIFFDDEIVGFAANMSHHVDVGGFAPGSMPFGAWEHFQEGLQIPPIKVARRGRFDEGILALISANVGGAITYQSGFNITPNSAIDTSNSGNNRPDAVGDPNGRSHSNRQSMIDQWFNTAAFAQAGQYTFATAAPESFADRACRRGTCPPTRTSRWAKAGGFSSARSSSTRSTTPTSTIPTRPSGRLPSAESFPPRSPGISNWALASTSEARGQTTQSGGAARTGRAFSAGAAPARRSDRIMSERRAANMSHHVDIGGFAPGSMPFGVREHFQEGLQIPPIMSERRSCSNHGEADFRFRGVRVSYSYSRQQLSPRRRQ